MFGLAEGLVLELDAIGSYIFLFIVLTWLSKLLCNSSDSLRFFFSIWNSILGSSMVSPVWVRFFRTPTMNHLIRGLVTLIFPHVVVGFVAPLLLGPTEKDRLS